MTSEPTLQTAQHEDDLHEALPFRGARLPALVLDQMLAGAVAFTDSAAEPIQPMDCVELRTGHDIGGFDGWLTVIATDRYSLYREDAEANTTVTEPAKFLLHRDHVRTLRSLLRSRIKACEKASREVLPVDLLWDDSGVLEVVCEDSRATFTEPDLREDQRFPDVAPVLDVARTRLDNGHSALDVAVNAELLARLKPLQKVHGVFRFERGVKPDPTQPNYGGLLVTPLEPPAGDRQRELAILLMVVRPTQTEVSA